MTSEEFNDYMLRIDCPARAATGDKIWPTIKQALDFAVQLKQRVDLAEADNDELLSQVNSRDSLDKFR